MIVAKFIIFQFFFCSTFTIFLLIFNFSLAFFITDVPICASPEPVIYGVSKNELVNIVCKVEANPSEVQFKWTFNNSAELIR